MSNTRRFVVPLCVVLPILVVTGGAPAAEPARPLPAAAYLGADVDAVIVVRDGDRHVQAVRELLASHRFAETPIARALLANPELMQGQIFLAGIGAANGTDAWSAVGAVLGRDLAIGLRATDGGRFRYIAAAVPRDAPLVDRLLETVYTATGLMRNGEPDPERHRTVGDHAFFRLDDDVIHARIGRAVILSDDRDLVKDAVAAQRDRDRCLAASPRHTAAMARLPDDATIGLYGDPAVLRHALGAADGEPLPETLPAVLFGAWWDTLRRSDDVVIGAVPGERSIALHAQLRTDDTLPPAFDGFLPAPTPATGAGFGPVPDTVGRLSIRRDWDSLFTERESIMSLAAASDFVNFANTLTTLLGQVDFVEDVLARVDGPVTLVAARQAFPADRVPTPQLPAFALVIPLEPADASDLRVRLHSGAISALAILNVDAAQNQRPTFLLDVEPHGAHRIVTARYPAPRQAGAEPAAAMLAGAMDAGDDAVAVVYNFAPAAAALDDAFLVATSPDLLRDVIDARETPENRAAATDRLVIDAAAAVHLLGLNREALIVNSMLKDDKPRHAAEGEIDTLLGLLGYAQTLELATTAAPREHTATLTLTLRPPAGSGD